MLRRFIHSFVTTLVVLSVLGAGAVPLRRQSISVLSQSQISVFKPYTSYASTAYCNAASTLTWSCGTNCLANPTFKPVASGGDGDDVQFWYVGYDPTLKTVVVGHQGTNPSEIEPVITDADFFLTTFDKQLFPNISTGIKVHDGFHDAQAKAAPLVLSAVQTALKRYGGSSVTVVGHSLGAAISLIDAVYLPLHIPGISVRAVLYGLPRVGNQAFADYVDAHVPSLTHINNKKDPVPILPGRLLGFHHPSGEVHIDQSGKWIACAGQDNTNAECEIGDVPSVLESDLDDHSGPYDGISMGCS
ncbi:hypothetical protein PHLGIDRAFT_105650 [Phlebiopsis gigantea 11061_1 CR5-6]|uniref:Fungal lipase-type domain-containing protein n=1 Tax=Phlebiopsis gigantea (strain 11061_1 CR5-6) TaxID=745531 RepID=A0A0C3PLQ4_PHLG1|nr:hypothetical protein PHLGIDRAFT_105650 [Phlebiopsis gigantea 11061_1 CR5-6]